MGRACSEDARVALFESVHVALVLHTGREMRVEPAQAATDASLDSALGGWAQLDDIDLRNTGSLGRDELSRILKFQRDQWAQLIREANECSSPSSPVPPRTPEEDLMGFGRPEQSAEGAGEPARL